MEEPGYELSSLSRKQELNVGPDESTEPQGPVGTDDSHEPVRLPQPQSTASPPPDEHKVATKRSGADSQIAMWRLSTTAASALKFIHTIDATSADVRDHYALERTWLAYNRTANTLASHAIVVTQLFVLHEHRRTVGRVCGAVMICGGIVIELVAAVRYLKQCRALVDKSEVTGVGRAISPTPTLMLCVVVVGGVCVGLFVVLLVVS